MSLPQTKKYNVSPNPLKFLHFQHFGRPRRPYGISGGNNDQIPLGNLSGFKREIGRFFEHLIYFPGIGHQDRDTTPICFCDESKKYNSIDFR